MGKKEQGFTLIEVMVVSMIIGILTAVAIPNFVSAQDRARIADVKSNMHVFRTSVETYAVDYGGLYPENVEQLHSEASNPESRYWQEILNPFTKLPGETEAYRTLSSSPDASGQQAEITPGVVAYIRYALDQAAPYAIYGGGKAPQRALLEHGEVFILSNR